MFRFLFELLRCRKAATAVEYGLIVSLIVLAMLAGFRSTSGATVELWSDLNNKVTNAR